MLGYFQMMALLLFSIISRTNKDYIIPLIFLSSVINLDIEWLVIGFLQDSLQNLFFTSYYVFLSIFSFLLLLRIKKQVQTLDNNPTKLIEAAPNQVNSSNKRSAYFRMASTMIAKDEKSKIQKKKFLTQITLLFLAYFPTLRNTFSTSICDDRDFSIVSGVDQGGLEEAECTMFEDMWSKIWFGTSVFNIIFVCFHIPLVIYRTINKFRPKIEPYESKSSRLKYHLNICPKDCQGACERRLLHGAKPIINTKRVLPGKGKILKILIINTVFEKLCRFFLPFPFS